MSSTAPDGPREAQDQIGGYRRRILGFSILTMSVIALVVSSTVIYFLYRVELDQRRASLTHTVESQARLIEAVARFDQLYSQGYDPGGAAGATISQIVDAHDTYSGIGETGEFTLARLVGDEMIFLLEWRHDEGDQGRRIPFRGNTRAEPMRRALSGESGAFVGQDYRGVTVLAAYEPVGELDLGIVAKIDLAEIRAPLIRSGLIALGVGALFTLAGCLVMFSVNNPILERVESSERELRRAREHADSANRAKSAFLANMSHELRTPMSAILGYSEMLIEEAEDRDQEHMVSDIQKIHGAGKHLLTLINDVLDLSKVDAGKMEIFAEVFDADHMIDGVCEIAAPLIERNANRLILERPKPLGEMTNDLTKLRQTLFNLISNAAKFTENGTITLAAHRLDSNEMEFTVTDTGIGMTADQLGKLFQAFSQAEASTHAKYGGTGLGLALSRKLCRLMGGDITVASEYGAGSTFTVRVPLSFGGPEAKVGPAREQTRPSGEGPSVLVIDDEETARTTLATFLAGEGFTVQTASSGEDGLRMVREQPPDLITLDILMPEMDGWEVLSRLNGEAELCNIPVVLITQADREDLGRALGATAYLHKPIAFDRLRAVLEQILVPDVNSHVLVVDDDEVTRAMLRKMLARAGQRCSEAANGRQALDLLGESRPDLIFLDLMMPVMDGFEFLETVAQRKDWRDIPIVVVSAKDLTNRERELLSERAQTVMTKGPGSRQDLLRVIENLVASKAEKRGPPRLSS